MKHAEGQHEIEVPEVLVEGGCISDSEIRPIAEEAPRTSDVLLARVYTHIIDVAEVVNELAGPAAEIEHACPG
jgi:hypothetical protein